MATIYITQWTRASLSEVTCGKLIMRTGIMDSMSLRGNKSQTGNRKQLTGIRKWIFLPAAHLKRLHVEVRPQDVDVGVQVKRSGSLALPCLPHLLPPTRRGQTAEKKKMQQENSITKCDL